MLISVFWHFVDLGCLTGIKCALWILDLLLFKLFCWMFFLLCFIWFLSLRAVSRDSWYCLAVCKLLEKMVHVNSLVIMSWFYFLHVHCCQPILMLLNHMTCMLQNFKSSENFIHKTSLKKFNSLFMWQI